MIKKQPLQTRHLPRTKRSFLLIEALVAITLLFIAGFSFFELQELITSKIRTRYLTIEKERIESLALGYLVENLYLKTFPWGTLEGEGEYHTSFQETPDWKVGYSFSFKEDKSEKPHTVFLLDVAVSVEHASEQLTNTAPKVYTFCVTKK